VSQPLQWKLFIKKRASATQGLPPCKDELKWVANTTTLIYGEQDALLVDTFLSDAQTADLAGWIATTGRRLSAIYITHGHPDHFFGLKLLRDRFPSARALALPQVVETMQRALTPDSVASWKRRFPGQIPDRLVAAEAVDERTFRLEGDAIVAIDIGHTDTDHTTCLHVPSIGLVVAGDAIGKASTSGSPRSIKSKTICPDWWVLRRSVLRCPILYSQSIFRLSVNGIGGPHERSRLHVRSRDGRRSAGRPGLG
jgi:glyoxylase-like metal-dependent hydrolase (beta-lactamase superfamily II)